MITEEDYHRTLRRFPIRRHLRFEIISRSGRGEIGTGQTISIGRKVVLFKVDRAIEAGSSLHIEISWPALRDGAVAVYLRLRGHIIHYEHPNTLVAIKQHEFELRDSTKRYFRHETAYVASGEA